MAGLRDIRALAAIVCASVACSMQARAEHLPAADTPGAAMHEPGRLYGGVAFQWQSLGFAGVTSPVRAFSGAGDLGAAGDNRFRVNLYGPQAHIGFAFREGALPAWLGRNFRIEFQGGWGTGTVRDGSARQLTGYTGPLAFDAANRIVSGATTVDLSLQGKIHVDKWTSQLRATSDFALVHNFFLSPSIGVFGGRTGTTYELRTTALYPAFASSGINDIRAHVDWSDTIGGKLGATLTWKATPALAFFVGGYAGIVHRTASMNSFDCSSFVNIGGATPCPANQRHASESRSTAALLAGGNAGAILRIDNWLIFTVSGGVEHDSRVPGYQARQTLAIGEAPSRLVFTRELNYSVMARIVVLFM